MITLLAMSTVFMTQTIFPELSDYFGIDTTQARFSFSMISLTYAISSFFIGPAADKYSLPAIASVGLFLLSITIRCASLATCFDFLIFILAIMGFCAALVPASMFPYIAIVAPKNKIGLSVGLIVASATLGVIFGRVSIGLFTSFLLGKMSPENLLVVPLLYTFFSLLEEVAFHQFSLVTFGVFSDGMALQ